jgi:molecular chaperone Hsp33
MDVEITAKSPAAFRCDCSKQRVERALISIGKRELQDMIDENKDIEVGCQFCGKQYLFSPEELATLRERATKE